MTKHVADKREPSNGTRVKAFVAVERRSGPEGSHPAVQATTRTMGPGDDPRRVQEFVRIERGREA